MARTRRTPAEMAAYYEEQAAAARKAAEMRDIKRRADLMDELVKIEDKMEVLSIRRANIREELEAGCAADPAGE